MTALPIPSPGEVWRHNKTAHLYRVIALGLDEATKEPVVVYRRYDNSDPQVWVRKLSSWMELVGQPLNVSHWKPRFERTNEDVLDAVGRP